MSLKKYDAIVVGELNVDLILNNIDSFPEIGKEKLAGNMSVVLGSSSAIFASNLSTLGAKVAFIGRVGSDSFGDFIIEKLQGKGVSTEFIIKDQTEKTGATIVLNYADDRAMVTYPGAMNNLTINDITQEALSSARHLHFSSYFLQPGIKNSASDLFRLAKEAGLTTSFDTQWDPAEKWDLNSSAVLPFVDIFMPNEQEMLHLANETNVDNAAKKLSSYCSNIIVKMGSKGSALYSKDKCTFQKSFLNNNVIDAIGAGDSFNAGFIYKFINGAGLDECHQFGNLTGAVNTTAAGGTAAFTNYADIKKIAEEKFGFTI